MSRAACESEWIGEAWMSRVACEGEWTGER